MKRALVVGLFTTMVALASPAAADDKAACLDAAAKAQTLRAAHHLLDARVQLRICAAANCPEVVQSDCVPWLAEVEKALPAVVVSAKNAAGADLIDVKVTVDGQPFATHLTGQAVAMDAGPHTFHFEAADGSTLDQQVLIKEGAKDQPVAVVLKSGGAGAAPAGAPAPSQGSPTGTSTLRTVGWIVGGVGVAGLAAGVVSGIIAVSDKSSANCNGNNVCQGSVSGVKSAALAADIGFIAGGVLVAGGAGLVLFAPRGAPAASSTGVRMLPVLTAGGGGLVAGGSF
jgi:hypothetical protein